MECIEAILTRRSCRKFKSQEVESEKIKTMLECAIFSPSPANKQPWDFIVATNPDYNHLLKEASDEAKKKLVERSGWKWMPKFKIDFITEAPVLIVVIGDPTRNGAEQFLDVPSQGYQQACSAAIQNMLLAAHSQGLSTLWLSLFEKSDVRRIFNISQDKDPIAIICVGYPDVIGDAPPRKGLETKVTYLD
ncbi:MAG: hypothetical protein CVU87_00905 [Firmicutes bacterium HGW-Firmicutes-12]|jgi:nitroreductase|nr:MAG: hypothetical protein CVU87_00905 [Firmicutes bacterium HGW-Firmicutes-12]